MSEKQSIERNRIHSHLTRSRFLHLEDALEIGKLRLFVGEYARGKGASSTAYHFLDLDDARVLFSDLAWGKAVEFADYKGTPTSSGNGEGPQSRVLKVKANGEKVWLEVANGPGEVVGEGAVKPKGKPDAAVSIPLSVWEARKLAFAVLAYVQAWEARCLGGILAGSSKAETKLADQVTSGATACLRAYTHRQAGQEIEPTSTGFWTLYNVEGRAAGVPYPTAQRIASEAGDDWQKALVGLCAATDEASAQTLD